MTDARCPGGLRPGQLSALELGRVIMGDIAVTIVDLAMRGFAVIDPDGDDWTVCLPREPVALRRQQELVGHERALVAGLPPPGRSPAPVLSALVGHFAPYLEQARTEIVKDAVRQHWIHRFHHDQLTSTGERLVADLHAFSSRLRRLRTEAGEPALAACLPYALHYHLVSRDGDPLARFAAAWVQAFDGLPGWRPPGAESRAYDPNEPWPRNPARYSPGMGSVLRP